MTDAPRPILLKRGVYKSVFFRVDGCPALLAIDSAHNLRKVVAITAGMDARTATVDLRAWLDDADPKIKLS